MLTEDQRYQILMALSKGYADTVIAKNIPGVTHMQVYRYRCSMGITSETVLENRYNEWMKLVGKGVALDVIAERYQVKQGSISIMLKRKKGFTVSDLKRAQQKHQEKAAGQWLEPGPFSKV